MPYLLAKEVTIFLEPVSATPFAGLLVTGMVVFVICYFFMRRKNAATANLEKALFPPKVPATTPQPFSQMIHGLRAKLGPAPRPLRPEENALWQMDPPSWMNANPDDFLWGIYHAQALLRAEGRVVWGQIVQANSKLFSAGDIDCPAAILYSGDPAYDDAPNALRQLATQMFALKGTSPADPELHQFAATLTDELRRDNQLMLPVQLTGGRRVVYTSIMVCRRHIPGGYLASNLLPLLICPAKTPWAMILPQAFWSPQWIAFWQMAASGR